MIGGKFPRIGGIPGTVGRNIPKAGGNPGTIPENGKMILRTPGINGRFQPMIPGNSLKVSGNLPVPPGMPEKNCGICLTIGESTLAMMKVLNPS
jgi:hypothetical protein